MIVLSDYKAELEHVMGIIKHTHDLEVAVFDSDAVLIACTESYFTHKGSSVHAPSVREVIYNQQVVVNKPGHMESCLGCRFKDCCPSAIEMLKSIIVLGEPIAVLAFTAFTPEGGAAVAADLERYSLLIEDYSQLISMILSHRLTHIEEGLSAAYLRNYLDSQTEGVICCDISGNIQEINPAAMKAFNCTGFCVKSIGQFFPSQIMDMITGGVLLLNYRVQLPDGAVRITTAPIMDDGRLTGTIVRILSRKSLPANSPEGEAQTPPSSLAGIKGTGAHIRAVKDRVALVADSSSTILITGETGTGKGLLAKAIHCTGNRRYKPFVMVNCAAIPEALFESELFGYEAGAFTGAKKEGKPGRFELADEGTIFLDEIGELSPAMQAKLLGVLQESSFERVGGITSIRLDVRVIAASNGDLPALVEQKKFRSDLYYRLNIIPFHLIPLRERREDIDHLTNEFLNRCNKKLNRRLLGFDNEAAAILRAHPWPGNIRQLENVVEYCANVTQQSVITAQQLPEDFLSQQKPTLSFMEPLPNIKTNGEEQSRITAVIDRYGWDVAGKTLAANELGISLRSLYRKLKTEESPE